MSFVEERFLFCPSLGAQSIPRYAASIARMMSGAERRNRFWQYPLCRFLIAIDPREIEEVQFVLRFFHAMGATECGFRFPDRADYKSCMVHETPTPLDQPLEPTGDSPGTYQLIKEYTVGTRTQQRIILKPVASTIRVANGDGDEQDADTWEIDETTGIITALEGFSGVPSSWGGEFDVPVRFESEELPIILQQNTIHGASFSLIELRNPNDEDD